MVPHTRIFSSLNCPGCDLPYDSSASGPRAPIQMYCLAGVLCNECWIKEKNLPKKERKHVCDYTNDGDCFHEKFYATYVLELLLNPSLRLSSQGNGYVLTQKFEVPECPICHEEYSIDLDVREPFDLRCGHLICHGCFVKIKYDSGRSDAYKVQAGCPMCRKKWNFRPTTPNVNPIIEFLKELPKMEEQISLIRALTKMESKEKCNDCHREKRTEKLFRCMDCKSTLCLRCAFTGHKTHDTEEFTLQEIERISHDLQEVVGLQINSYKGIINGLQANNLNRIDTFEKTMMRKVEDLRTVSFHEAVKKEAKYREINEHFEMISEDYLLNIREYEKKLLDLESELNKDEK